MMILSGCLAKGQNKIITEIDLPTAPDFLSYEVATELDHLCRPRDKCDSINEFKNKYFLFLVKYEIYRKNYKTPS